MYVFGMDTRHKKMASFRFDSALMDRLEAWIAQQEFPPTKTAVIEVALSEFLSGRKNKRSYKQFGPSGRGT